MCSVNKYNVRDVLVPKPRRKSARTASSRPLIILLKKTLYQVEASGSQHSFNICW